MCILQLAYARLINSTRKTVQFSSVQFTQSCLTLQDPMDCSMPGHPVQAIIVSIITPFTTAVTLTTILAPEGKQLRNNLCFKQVFYTVLYFHVLFFFFFSNLAIFLDAIADKGLLEINEIVCISLQQFLKDGYYQRKVNRKGTYQVRCCLLPMCITLYIFSHLKLLS